MKSRQVVYRLLREMARRPGLIAGAFSLVLLASALQPLRPYLYRYMIDHPIRQKDLTAFWFWGGIILLVTLIHPLVQRWQILATQRLAWDLIHRLRLQLFRKVLRLSIPALERYPAGLLYTRLLTDTQTLQSTLSETLLVIAGELLQLAVLISLMFLLDPVLALATLGIMPLGLLISRYFSLRIRQSFARVRHYISLMNAYLHEFLRTRELSWALYLDSQLLRRFHRLNQLFYKSYRRTIGYFSFFFPAMDLVTVVGMTAVLTLGSYRLVEGQTSMGTLVAFSLYLQLFFRPFRVLADQVNSLQMGIVSSERIFRLLDNPHMEAVQGQIPAGPRPYQLEVRGLRFGYDPAHPVLRDLSFQAKPGEVIALSAPTGSGKSTFFYLLLGYYQPQAGEIVYGGVSITAWDKARLRQEIAYIPQEPVLFEGTLLENLTLYEPFTTSQIREAARLIGIPLQDWSLDMRISTGGQNLSAGQRQLIALWRASLRRPSLWLLDEPTARLDPESEKLIYQSLRALAHEAIVLLISHRPEAQAYRDRVLVILRSHAA